MFGIVKLQVLKDLGGVFGQNAQKDNVGLVDNFLIVLMDGYEIGKGFL